MNISEIRTLDDNLREYYNQYKHPLLHMQIRGYKWDLNDNKIWGVHYSERPLWLSKWLFDWVND